jgi:biopolymer transport protein ExbD
MMRLISLILPLCLLASCKQEAPATVRVPSGPRSGDLPVSSFSEKLSTTGNAYIEAVIDNENAEIHHPNGSLNSTDGGESYDQVIKSLSKIDPAQAGESPLLISASASTQFTAIRSVIRSAASSGIHEVLFLVRSETHQIGILRIELPTMGDPLPKFDPFFIQIDDKGQIFTGAGASRTRMDDGPNDRDLEKLNSQLELFSAAAKAANSGNAPCQIYVNPEASYQRMIDLMSTIKKWGLRPYLIDMEPEPRPKPILRKPRKPTAPYRSIPLPLAPPKEGTDQRAID